MAAMIWQFIGVAVGMFVLDFVWTECVKAVNAKRAGRASLLSVGFQVLSGVVTIAYVHSPILLLGAAVGAYIGTYAAVSRGAA